MVALHKFIFQYEGDRSNRKRLREFDSFKYNENNKEYAEKVKYVNGNLNSGDLV